MEPTDSSPLGYRVTYNVVTRRYYVERPYVYRSLNEQIVAKGLTYREATALASVLDNTNQHFGE